MTKKDYIKVAELMKDIRKSHSTYDADGFAVVRLVTIEDGLVDIFREDNARFNRERFLAACNR